MVQGNLLNIGPAAVHGAPEVADWIGGGGESAPEGDRERFTRGKGPVMGDARVTYLQYEY